MKASPHCIFRVYLPIILLPRLLPVTIRGMKNPWCTSPGTLDKAWNLEAKILGVDLLMVCVSRLAVKTYSEGVKIALCQFFLLCLLQCIVNLVFLCRDSGVRQHTIEFGRLINQRVLAAGDSFQPYPTSPIAPNKPQYLYALNASGMHSPRP